MQTLGSTSWTRPSPELTGFCSALQRCCFWRAPWLRASPHRPLSFHSRYLLAAPARASPFAFFRIPCAFLCASGDSSGQNSVTTSRDTAMDSYSSIRRVNPLFSKFGALAAWPCMRPCPQAVTAPRTSDAVWLCATSTTIHTASSGHRTMHPDQSCRSVLPQ